MMTFLVHCNGSARQKESEAYPNCLARRPRLRVSCSHELADLDEVPEVIGKLDGGLQP